MEQVKALNALEPFLALSRSASSARAAADLVVRATSAPNTFLFTELLQTPQIQALATSPEYAPYLTALQIFSYGTYASYVETAGLPPLTDAQALKLRQLSLLTLAKDTDKSQSSTPALGYATLVDRLGLSSPLELEEIVISAIYAGLINAQLDPKNEMVQINKVAPLRDVAPAGAIGGLLESLQAWAGRCEVTLQSLEAQMSGLRSDADRRAAEAASWTQKLDKLVEDENRGQQGAPVPGGQDQIAGAKNALLTVGAGSNIFAGLGAGARSAAAAASPSLVKTQHRYNKRGSGHMEASREGDVDEEAMDVDDDDEVSDGKKRASRRKL